MPELPEIDHTTNFILLRAKPRLLDHGRIGGYPS